MKLLFDQNISFRIVKRIISIFPDSHQVRELGLEEASDITIWNFARKNEYTIVTFDSDFYDYTVVRGIPPKVIWLRLGNTSTKVIRDLLISKVKQIQEFCDSEEMAKFGCLEIMA